MKIKFLGASGCVTGSCYLLKTGKGNIMVDCGFFQGNEELEARNYLEFDFVPAEIDYLILTHAHLDHSGLIPRLVRLGFHGKIICTEGTSELLEIILKDAAHIQEKEYQERKEKSRRKREVIQLLYSLEDVDSALALIETVSYERMVSLNRWLSVEFFDAGHIIGSSSVLLRIQGEGESLDIVFSGDIGNFDRPILKNPKSPPTADYLLIETTYGYRLHEPKEMREEILADVVDKAIRNKGTILIPSFAVGRTQEILYTLSQLKNNRPHWNNLKIFVDSPMATAATLICAKHFENFDGEIKKRLKNGDDPFLFEGLAYVDSAEESKELKNIPPPKIIISASGMATAGRIRHHLADYLADKNAQILIVGYQAEGTLGRLLHEHVKEVKLFGRKIKVNAEITSIGAFSAHADREGLLRWLDAIKDKPREIFLVHGEEKSRDAFAKILVEQNFITNSPLIGDTFELAPKKAEISLPSRVTPVKQKAITHPADFSNKLGQFMSWFNKEAELLKRALTETINQMEKLSIEETDSDRLLSYTLIFDDLLKELDTLYLNFLTTFKSSFINLRDWEEDDKDERNVKLEKLKSLLDYYSSQFKKQRDGLMEEVYNLLE